MFTVLAQFSILNKRDERVDLLLYPTFFRLASTRDVVATNTMSVQQHDPRLGNALIPAMVSQEARDTS